MSSEAESGRFQVARTGVIVRRRGRIARVFRNLAAQRDRGMVRYAALCEAIADAGTPDAIVAALESGLPAVIPCESIVLELYDGDALSPRPALLPTAVPGVAQPVPTVAVPLRHANSIVGWLQVCGRFSHHERTVLESLGGMIGTAIRSRRHLQHLETTITYLEQRNSELEALSTADALTGIPNRRAFDTALGNEWRRITRSGGTLSLLLIDIDHFKDFNDGHGHLAGDECLRLVATLLAGAVRRAGDFVARIGGEEFGVVLPDTPADAAERLANDLCERVRYEGFSHPGFRVSAHLTVSVGIASARPAVGTSPADLYAEADAALYRAKRAGRDVVSR